MKFFSNLLALLTEKTRICLLDPVMINMLWRKTHAIVISGKFPIPDSKNLVPMHNVPLNFLVMSEREYLSTAEHVIWIAGFQIPDCDNFHGTKKHVYRLARRENNELV